MPTHHLFLKRMTQKLQFRVFPYLRMTVISINDSTNKTNNLSNSSIIKFLNKTNMDDKISQNVIQHYLRAILTRIYLSIKVKMKIVNTSLCQNINRLQIVNPHRCGYQECQNSPKEQLLNQSLKFMVLIFRNKLSLLGSNDREWQVFLSSHSMKTSFNKMG